MRSSSITFKLLSIVVSTSILTTIFFLLMVDGKLKGIIDQSHNAMYAEKVDVIWHSLEQVDERLHKTGLVDAYIEDFQKSAIGMIRDSYYQDPKQDVYPFILDGAGRVVMHPVLPAGDESLKNHEGMKQQSLAERGDFISVYKGQAKWYVYRRFDTWDWVLGYVVPLDVKYAAAHAFRSSLLMVMVGVGLLVLIILSFVLTRFTKPIVTLTQHASEIAGGDLDQPIDIGGKDEVGMLARSFDNMRDSIKQRIADLNHEIEERKRAEVKLQRNEENLRITLDSIGDAVIATDTKGAIVRMNPVAEMLSGWSFSEAKGKPLYDVLQIVNATSRESIERTVDTMFAGGEIVELSDESILIARDGTEYHIADSGAPIRSDQGELLGMVMVFRDITLKMALEERLRQSHKMDAIGQLAGGVAHDFNNMLGGILGAAEVLKEYMPADPQAEKFQSIIIDSAGRAAGLTQKLLSFARKQPVASTAIDAHQMLVDTIELLESTIDRRISVVSELSANASQVVGDPSQLQNAFLNLGINAAHAMPEGGTIQFRTATVHINKEESRVSPFEIKPGNYLEVKVCDTGTGIVPDDLPRIFEPFFTTKEQGRGTGLGLAAVFGTVKQHRGAIAVENNASAGATFRVLLPLSAETSVPVEKRVAPEMTGAGTILVVDDEKVLRSTAKAILQHFGYSVLLAENGQQALELYSADPTAIDLVILDMIMPVMNGSDCFAALHNVDPHVRAILTSGFTQEEDVEQMKADGLCGFLHKPYSGADLSQMIHDILGG